MDMELDEDNLCDIHEDCNETVSIKITKKISTPNKKRKEKDSPESDLISSELEEGFNQITEEILGESYNKSVNICPQLLVKICESLQNTNSLIDSMIDNEDFSIIPNLHNNNNEDFLKEIPGVDDDYIDRQKKMRKINNFGENNKEKRTTNRLGTSQTNINSYCSHCTNEIKESQAYFMVKFTDRQSSFYIHEDCVSEFEEELEQILEENEEKIVAGRI